MLPTTAWYLGLRAEKTALQWPWERDATHSTQTGLLAGGAGGGLAGGLLGGTWGSETGANLASRLVKSKNPWSCLAGAGLAGLGAVGGGALFGGAVGAGLGAGALGSYGAAKDIRRAMD